MTDDQKQSIGKALGRVVSGVYILTARYDLESSAMMASWVMQAGFDPPTVTIALGRGRPIARLIAQSHRLALSILPDGDKLLMKHYARLKPGDDPFAGITTKPAPSGVPVLADGLGWLDCQLVNMYDFGGDHELVVAKITAGEILRDGTAFAHQRGNGFHY